MDLTNTFFIQKKKYIYILSISQLSTYFNTKCYRFTLFYLLKSLLI